MERSQLNLRISEELGRLIDKKRIDLSKGGRGAIPSRSDVLRMALAEFLKVDLSEIEQDRRRSSAKG